MSIIPRSKNIEKVARAVFSDESQREAFLQALERGEEGIKAVAWLRSEPLDVGYQRSDNRPGWLPSWIEVAAGGSRPGALPEHETGDFYLLDLSSTFAAAPLSEINDFSGLIIDVCAAPGGKGILAWRYLKPDLIVANEVIRKRTAQLISNYKRCALDPAMVTSCDPGLLATLIDKQAQLVIVDAPCSGQSLVLKGMAAPGAFHPATISMNERRQRRILANSAALVAPGGYLLYSTCTFSPEENEENIAWFIGNFPDFSSMSVGLLVDFRSDLSEHFTYRLAPQMGFGAGGFVTLLRRNPPSAAEHFEDLSSITPANAASIVWPVWTSPQVVPQKKNLVGVARNNSRYAGSDKGRERKRGARRSYRG